MSLFPSACIPTLAKLAEAHKKTAANRGLFISERDYFLTSAAGAAAGETGTAGASFLASSM